MHFWGVLNDEAPHQSSVVELPPKSNVEMTTTSSTFEDRESEDASRDSVEESGPTKGNMFVQGSPWDEAFVEDIMATIITAHLKVRPVIRYVEKAPRMEVKYLASTLPTDEGVVVTVVRPEEGSPHASDEGKDHSLSKGTPQPMTGDLPSPLTGGPVREASGDYGSFCMD